MGSRLNPGYEQYVSQHFLRKHSISGLTLISAFDWKRFQIESYSQTLYREKASWGQVAFHFVQQPKEK